MRTSTCRETLHTALFYCVTIAYHVELNADLGWPQALGQRLRKIDRFIVGRRLYSPGTLPNSSSFSRCNFEPYPSAVIQRGGRVGVSSVPHGKLVAYKSFI